MSFVRRILNMNSYLKEVKTLVTERNPVLVVIGNESVDLDSAVSSISLAFHLNIFFLHILKEKYDINKVSNHSHVIPLSERSKQFLAVPVINCARDDLMLKTEVTYWLLKHYIELDSLLCRDEIDLTNKVDSFVLVDHHVSEFRDKVISVLDHRPFDINSNLNRECFTNIQEVGSCATLLVDAINKDVQTSSLNSAYSDVLKLCYGAIVLDTINFSKEADKVRPLDIETSELIESLLGIEDATNHRKKLYEELVAARADVSSLDSLQILSKDLKIISSDNGNIRVAIPGVDVFKYIEMENAEANVKIFAERSKIDVLILMGLVPKGDTVERSLGVINIKNEALFAGVSRKILFLLQE